MLQPIWNAQIASGYCVKAIKFLPVQIVEHTPDKPNRFPNVTAAFKLCYTVGTIINLHYI